MIHYWQTWHSPNPHSHIESDNELKSGIYGLYDRTNLLDMLRTSAISSALREALPLPPARVVPWLPVASVGFLISAVRIPFREPPPAANPELVGALMPPLVGRQYRILHGLQTPQFRVPSGFNTPVDVPSRLSSGSLVLRRSILAILANLVLLEISFLQLSKRSGRECF